MNFESKTIKECINDIEDNIFVMPAIQREFVWYVEQIEGLFDSLMQGFPISSFLFWRIDESKVNNYQFYKFIKHYHEKNNKHNIKYDSKRASSLMAILDGQQRLTSLYIALAGSYAYRLPYGRKDNSEAYPARRLYLDLLTGDDNSNNISKKYNFLFLTQEDVNRSNKKWFEVGKILDTHDISHCIDFALDLYENKDDIRQAQRNLSKLWNIIYQEKAINYHLEKTDSLDKVLQIFIRVNSGGTKLSYSDLLLSIATSEWEEKEAREEITHFVDEINNLGFKVSKDFILKSCLVLSDFNNIAFNIENFNKPNMNKIENNWNNIKKSLLIAFETLKSFCLDSSTVNSNNAVIPIAYYIFKIGCPDNFSDAIKHAKSREFIYKWLVKTSLKQTFSGQPDNVLKYVRESIKNSNSDYFPLEEITSHLKKHIPNKSISFDNDEDFNFILDLKYGKANTYLVLALLYEGKNPSKVYHQDHIFPKYGFNKNQLSQSHLTDEEIIAYEEKRDCIANVQLLEGNLNQSKSKKEFKIWLDQEYQDESLRNSFLMQQRIPKNHSLEFKDFLDFITKREYIIINEIKKII